MTPTDPLHRAQAGDECAFDDLAREWRPYVRKVCWSYLRNPEDIEDAVQDALVRLIVNVDRVDARSPLGPYVGAIARNACLDKIRLGTPARGGTGEGGADVGTNAGTEHLEDRQPSPVGRLTAAETLGALQHCLDRLQADKRLLLVLHYGHGVPQNELRNHWPGSLPFWKSKQTISSHMRDARTALGRCLRVHAVDEEAAGVFLAWMRAGG